MTMTDLETLASEMGAASIPEFVNTYVKTFAGGNSGMTIDINTTFDYKEKKPLGPIYRCISVLGDLLELVPAIDYNHEFGQRWFEHLFMNVSNIQGVTVFAKDKNPVRVQYEKAVKKEYNENRFINRQNTKIRNYDEGSGVDAANFIPSKEPDGTPIDPSSEEAKEKYPLANPEATPVYENRINNDEDKQVGPTEESTKTVTPTVFESAE